jgi:hypothetical protein
MSLSKVVQRVRNYLHIDFQQGKLNGCEVMHIFCDSTYCAALFLSLWHNLRSLINPEFLSKVSQWV